MLKFVTLAYRVQSALQVLAARILLRLGKRIFMNHKAKMNWKGFGLFVIPILFVVITMWAISARKSALEREQVMRIKYSHAMLMYQADGSTKTVYHYHPPMRLLTRWESLVFFLERVVRGR